MVKVKQEEENKKMAQELEEQRVKQAVKDQIKKKLTTQVEGEGDNHLSINESSRNFEDADAPLLSGDHDEETRQSVRVAEAQKAGIEGSNERIGDEMLQTISNNL